jgi:hypothetical protein
VFTAIYHAVWRIGRSRLGQTGTIPQGRLLAGNPCPTIDASLLSIGTAAADFFHGRHLFEEEPATSFFAAGTKEDRLLYGITATHQSHGLGQDFRRHV